MQPGRNQLHEAKPSAIYLPGCITSAIHHKIAQQHMLLQINHHRDDFVSAEAVLRVELGEGGAMGGSTVARSQTEANQQYDRSLDRNCRYLQ